jgi:hypothetical protein
MGKSSTYRNLVEKPDNTDTWKAKIGFVTRTLNLHFAQLRSRCPQFLSGTGSRAQSNVLVENMESNTLAPSRTDAISSHNHPRSLEYNFFGIDKCLAIDPEGLPFCHEMRQPVGLPVTSHPFVTVYSLYINIKLFTSVTWYSLVNVAEKIRAY